MFKFLYLPLERVKQVGWSIYSWSERMLNAVVGVSLPGRLRSRLPTLSRFQISTMLLLTPILLNTELNFISWCLTVDNLNTSFEFMLQLIFGNSTRDTDGNFQIYGVGNLDRYLIYSGLMFVNWLLLGLFWELPWKERTLGTHLPVSVVLSLVIGCLVCPILVNWIGTSKAFKSAKGFVKRKGLRLFEFCTLHLSVHLINTICLSVLQYNPGITTTELRLYVSQRNLENVLDFIKLFVFRIGIQYLKHVNSMLAGAAEQFYQIYSWKTTSTSFSDPLPQIPDAKEKLRILISNRAWHIFYNHYMIKLMLAVYEDKTKTRLKDKIVKYHTAATLQFSKICTIATLTSVLGRPYFNGPVTIFLTLLFAQKPTLSSIWLMVVSCFFVQNLWIYIFLSQCSTLAKMRPIAWSILQIKKFVSRELKQRCVLNGFARRLIWTTMFMYVTSLINWKLGQLRGVEELVSNSVLFSLLGIISPVPGTVWMLSLFGWFSNYSIAHLVYLSGLLYLNSRFFRAKHFEPINFISDYEPTVEEHDFIELELYDDGQNDQKLIEGQCDEFCTLKTSVVAVENYFKEGLSLAESKSSHNISSLSDLSELEEENWAFPRATKRSRQLNQESSQMKPQIHPTYSQIQQIHKHTFGQVPSSCPQTCPSFSQLSSHSDDEDHFFSV